MNAPRVLLLTVRGPGGQVDVAAREDATVAELVTAVAESLGDTVVATTVTAAGNGKTPPAGERPVAKTATLTQAGLLDGHVLTVSDDVITVDDQVVASAEGAQ